MPTNKPLSRSDEPVGFDALGREIQLLSLAEVIATAQPPLVVGIHGDWGEGKTSFMKILGRLLDAEERDKYLAEGDRLFTSDEGGKRWRESKATIERFVRKMQKEDAREPFNIPSVFFNPWKHQFEEEPIFPLLDAIRVQLPSAWSKIGGKFRDFVEDPRIRILSKASLGVAKLAGPDWFSALADQAGTKAKEVMDAFADFDRSFGKTIEDLIGSIVGADRLVIFIDDLDRCEAEYVVKILEALKLHLMNDKCIYVLGCSPRRIRECLVEKMGVSDDGAQVYLEKIVQIPLRLPPVSAGSFRHLLLSLGCEKYVENQLCWDMLRSFAEHNPRRLKRFLLFYEMEKSMIELVPDLLEQTLTELQEFGIADDGEIMEAYLFGNKVPHLPEEQVREALLMKIKLIQFLGGEGHAFTTAEDFLVDVAPWNREEKLDDPVRDSEEY
ncbi:KAP family NTPase [bacterium]|nr:KAP family NTPase [bacterium]